MMFTAAAPAVVRAQRAPEHSAAPSSAICCGLAPRQRAATSSAVQTLRRVNPAGGESYAPVFRAELQRTTFHGRQLPGRRAAGSPHAHAPTSAPDVRAESSRSVDERGHDELGDLIKQGVVTVLRDASKNMEYFIVGTAHVSTKSVGHVRHVIRAVKPEAVMVELCPARGTSTLLLHPEEHAKLVQFTRKDAKKLAKKAGWLYVGLRYFYSAVSKKMGVVAGAEFMAAAEEAAEIGAQIVLGDRPVDITLRRLARFAQTRLLPAFLLLEGAGLIFDQIQGSAAAQAAPEVTQAAAGGISPIMAALGTFLLTGSPFTPLSSTLGDTSDYGLRAAAFTADLLGVVASLPIMLGISVGASMLVLSSNLIDNLIRLVQKTNIPAPGPLVGERDDFLVWSMRQHPLVPKQDARVVVVVGAAHVRGIERRFRAGRPVDVAPLVFDPRHDSGDAEEVLERLRAKDEAAHAVIAERQAQRAGSVPPK